MPPPIRLDRFPHSAADDHVELLVGEARDQRRRGSGVIGRIAIGHDVDVGVDISEHATDDVALALHPLAPDDRASGCGDLDGAVAAVVVVDVDRRIGKRGAEARDRLRDRGFLVVAGQQDCDCRRVRHSPFLVTPDLFRGPPGGRSRNRHSCLAVDAGTSPA